ncbi:cell division protein ftsQ [Oceanicola granulosus HTCC2516]|uniref:Cell division protein FtsQ n=1 Tax=Oceanicola granulosus (strain ATCC BAA-861 / DSM 15982 / KCTC 12143 / HTCC2516) TaxID=314256 RepID=Q2CIW4_OCEGH|nr:cell division protein FtsQ/DivIB [Oceanicola granulosus]EAR52475.1 cell division protein ftsQ [Oceanicola granulosus HTCC2516]
MSRAYRDPAPSRWRYRYQRLMLTPGFRRMLRVGLPLLVVAGIGGGWISQPANRDTVAAAYAQVRDQIQNRPEFLVTAMAVEGADAGLSAEIRRVLPVEFPVSSFLLDLEEMRQTVGAVAAVESARVRVRPGGVLEVAVTQRVPAAVWRTRDGLKLIDASGTYVAPLANRAARPDLPLVAGEGADAALAEALALYGVSRPLGDELRGLVRMGARRWDVVLADGQKVMLPAEGAVQAMERVLALDEAKDLFGRDIAAVDMRNSARPTIRLNPPAMVALRRVAEQEPGQGQ